jgi:hypothetical protein
MRVFPLPRTSELGPFAALLVTLVAMLLLSPFLSETILGVSRLRLLTAILLLAGVYAVSHRRRALAAALAIAVPQLVLEACLSVRPSSTLVLASLALSTLFFFFLGAVLLYAILDEERIHLDTILGGICVYLLLGVIWSLVYSILEYLQPGSFAIDGQLLPAPLRPDDFRHEELIYYSFVTLTTVGYGDVLAKTNPARAVAAAEAVTGSLYIAVFIARLVGLHMVHQRRDLDL